jgi:hypothetical protein
MPRQEQIAFIKAIRNIQLSPVCLRELWKAVTAGRKEKALATTKDNAGSDSALKQPSGVGGEVRISRDPLQLHVSQRKAEELSSSDCLSEPANPRPAPGHLLVTGPRSRALRGKKCPVYPTTRSERGWAGIPSMTLKYLPPSFVYLLVVIVNATFEGSTSRPAESTHTRFGS